MARAANARTNLFAFARSSNVSLPVCRPSTWLSSSASRAPRSTRVVQATETVRGYCQRDVPEAAGGSRPRGFALLRRED
jgi:hypothetical protein